ncbi:MAG: ribosomal RNA adenine methyltransferase [Cenarchaeum symbiont of Oopsacas minuta]|nr:ribosomal RNA adenine methyltransferase [Cenarchaeum symbiont of Oopsacas minuta]
MNQRQYTGRHFLRSSEIANLMVKAAEIRSKDNILEIGTGHCALTPLLGGKNVITYETDRQMYADAIVILKKYSNIKVICGDGFKSQEQFDVFVSSLPYSQSRRAIEWLMQRKFSRAVIMVQEEFAQKLFSYTGKQRKAISVLAYCGFDIERIAPVSKNNFYPIPAVESVILRIKQKRIVSLKIIQEVNKIFSYRRKTLSNIPKFDRFKSKARLDSLSCDEIIGALDGI